MLQILNHPQLKRKLSEGGVRTAQAYCHKREARETLAYFKELIGG
jgi:hypothetical protein